MKKNKLFTVLAAVAMLSSTGVGLVESNAPVAQAAKKSKKHKKTVKKTVKKSKKTVKKAKKSTAKYAYVRIKRGAVAYKPVFNTEGTKLKKVVRLKYKKRAIHLRSLKARALWSVKYKKTTYYYVVVKKQSLMVRAKDTTRVGKKRVPTMASLQAAYKKKLDNWNEKLTAALPKTATAKVSTATKYFTVPETENDKPTLSKEDLAKDTQLTVLAKVPNGINLSNGSSIDAYLARTSDKKLIYIPAENVTLDDPKAQLLDQDAYLAAVKNYNEINEAAKKDLGIK